LRGAEEADHQVAEKREINAGHPLIISVDEDHWATVYDYGQGCIFIADPALGRSYLCRHSTNEFRARWDKWAIAARLGA
jgi:ABC-type bacteriocin/lantibiotic exporter with double-glycine peptidase domain